jgi:hypothetical protein
MTADCEVGRHFFAKKKLVFLWWFAYFFVPSQKNILHHFCLGGRLSKTAKNTF